MGKISDRKCGRCAVNTLITRVTLSEKRRMQQMLWKLCDENRRLGGKYWKTVLNKYGITEKDLWPPPKEGKP